MILTHLYHFYHDTLLYIALIYFFALSLKDSIHCCLGSCNLITNEVQYNYIEYTAQSTVIFCKDIIFLESGFIIVHSFVRFSPNLAKCTENTIILVNRAVGCV